MICEECKICWNYEVCENGCHGSTEPCDKFINEDKTYGIINSKEEYCEKVFALAGNFAKAVTMAFEPVIEAAKETMKDIDKIMKKTNEPDTSRQKFKAVACKGRNRKGRW